MFSFKRQDIIFKRNAHYSRQEEILDTSMVLPGVPRPKLRSNMRNSISDMTKRNSICSIKGEPERRKPNIKEFSSNATMHGMYPVFGRHGMKCRRFMWSMIFAVAFTLFTYNITNRVILYYSYPHSTALEELQTFNKTLQFPQISFCNKNSYRWSQFTPEDLIYSNELTGLLDWSTEHNKYFLANPTTFDHPDNLYMREYLNMLLAVADLFGLRFERRDFSVFDFTNRTGHDFDTFLLECKFRGRKCKRNWFEPIFTRFGKCYTFNSGNSGEIIETLKGGQDNGLQLLLDVQTREYLPIWHDKHEVASESGFKVQIHSQKEPPFLSEYGFGVSPGFQTLVGIKEQRLNFLPAPWGDCRSVKNTVENFEKIFKTYSVSACNIACEAEFIHKHCDCKMVHMPKAFLSPDCNPIQYIKCADKAFDWLMTSNQKACRCETPCESTKYILSTSMLKLPSKYGAFYYAEKYNRSDDYIAANFIKLNIYFENLNYESISQVAAYEFSSLLGRVLV